MPLSLTGSGKPRWRQTGSSTSTPLHWAGTVRGRMRRIPGMSILIKASNWTQTFALDTRHRIAHEAVQY
jgi:hypothetical protein